MISRKGAAPEPKAVTRDVFDREVKKIKGAQQKSDDSRADLGNAYQSAETWGLNRPALKLALKIEGMEDAKRNDFLADVDTYLKWLGVTFQGELFGAGVETAAKEAGASGHRQAGYDDGLAGKGMDPTREDWGSTGQLAYEEGWQKGQEAKVAAQMDIGNGRRKNGHADQPTA